MVFYAYGSQETPFRMPLSSPSALLVRPVHKTDGGHRRVDFPCTGAIILSVVAKSHGRALFRLPIPVTEPLLRQFLGA